MINGDRILKEKYPDHIDSDFTPNGLDLRLGAVYEVDDSELEYGLFNDSKNIPKHNKLHSVKNDLKPNKIGWYLLPYRAYILEVANKIKISDDAAQLYKPRSTLLRAGIMLGTAVGDKSYFGKLSFLCVNMSNRPFFLERMVRFAQLIDFELKDSDTSYDGSYQNDKHKRDIEWPEDNRIQF